VKAEVDKADDGNEFLKKDVKGSNVAAGDGKSHDSGGKAKKKKTRKRDAKEREKKDNLEKQYQKNVRFNKKAENKLKNDRREELK